MTNGCMQTYYDALMIINAVVGVLYSNHLIAGFMLKLRYYLKNEHGAEAMKFSQCPQKVDLKTLEKGFKEKTTKLQIWMAKISSELVRSTIKVHQATLEDVRARHAVNKQASQTSTYDRRASMVDQRACTGECMC